MSAPSETIGSYLKMVTSTVGEVMGESLVALYLHGSAVQQDFDPSVSDVDILGIVKGPLDANLRNALTRRLNHEALPCPVQGFEFILCTAQSVQEPIFAMPFEYALSTGPHWPLQHEHSSAISDTLIHLTLCRQSGRVLLGPSPSDLVAPVPIALLRRALVAELEWHLEDLGKSLDRAAQRNAVLNAARSASAARTGYILSKSEGARRWSAIDPFADLVARAFESRMRRATDLDTEEIRAFLRRVIAMIEALPDATHAS